MNDEPRVILIDAVDGDEAAFETWFFERNGCRVVACHGPEHGTACPLLAGTRCAKVDASHGIVFALDLDRPQHHDILERYREILRPDVPIRAVVRVGQAERYADILENVELWHHAPTVEELDGFAAQVEGADRPA